MGNRTVKRKVTALFLTIGSVPLILMGLSFLAGTGGQGATAGWPFLLWLVFSILAVTAGTIVFVPMVLRDMADDLAEVNEISSAMGRASVQVYQAGENLSRSMDSQAISVEETATSLNELASMTSENREHSRQSSLLVGSSTEKLKEANHCMKSLIESMNATSAASDDVAKIIKTIDEIAFQTNLLALNAAVEAARAGEAGAGFSVVAEEVRNLARRSSEASVSTQELIRDVIKKIKEGTELVGRTDDFYRDVAVNVQKVNSLMDNISRISQDQARGIDDVQNNVTSLQRILEENAAKVHRSFHEAEKIQSNVDRLQNVAAGRSGTSAVYGQRTESKPFAGEIPVSVGASGKGTLVNRRERAMRRNIIAG